MSRTACKPSVNGLEVQPLPCDVHTEFIHGSVETAVSYVRHKDLLHEAMSNPLGNGQLFVRDRNVTRPRSDGSPLLAHEVTRGLRRGQGNGAKDDASVTRIPLSQVRDLVY